MSTICKLGRGNLRKVSLMDLPDNDRIFDKLDELDIAIRYDLSPAVASGTSVRYMDAIMWLKDGVGLDIDQIEDLSNNWAMQVEKLASEENFINIFHPLTVPDYANAIRQPLPPSISKPLGDTLILEPDTYKVSIEKLRLYTHAGNSGLSGCSLVEVNDDRTMYRPYGKSSGFETVGTGTIRPLPRETLNQGHLTIVKVSEPIEKLGPKGYKIIISGNLGGCSALMAISDKVPNITDGDFQEIALQELNHRWKELYTRAAINKDVFDKLSKDYGFKLKRDYHEVSSNHFYSLMEQVDSIEKLDWKYPSIKFSPVRPGIKYNSEIDKMLFSQLNKEQTLEVTLNLPNYLPTVD